MPIPTLRRSAMTVLIVAGLILPPAAGANGSTRDEDEPARDVSLAGTSWKLVRFQGGDGRVLTPAQGQRYTLTFAPDGRIAARIACNRGRSTWTAQGISGLAFGPLALTRAMCPPDPLQDRLARDWSFVRSYVLKDGRLYLALMADGGIYEFER